MRLSLVQSESIPFCWRWLPRDDPRPERVTCTPRPGGAGHLDGVGVVVTHCLFGASWDDHARRCRGGRAQRAAQADGQTLRGREAKRRGFRRTRYWPRSIAATSPAAAAPASCKAVATARASRLATTPSTTGRRQWFVCRSRRSGSSRSRSEARRLLHRHLTGSSNSPRASTSCSVGRVTEPAAWMLTGSGRPAGAQELVDLAQPGRLGEVERHVVSCARPMRR